MLIAPLTASDRADWQPLWDAYLTFYETDLDPAITETTFTRLTTPGSGLHGAMARDASGMAVGLVHWLTHPATWSTSAYCYLEDLFVSADTRGAGAGAALIEHVRAWAEHEGAEKVYWLTAETNATARRLYDRVAARTGFVHYQIAL